MFFDHTRTSYEKPSILALHHPHPLRPADSHSKLDNLAQTQQTIHTTVREAEPSLHQKVCLTRTSGSRSRAANSRLANGLRRSLHCKKQQ